ncbi:MAG: hypothetical protein QGG36_16785 [Pirellulaceae bacterium]|jgi:hypothetical protein|nr:hypothetical protein [Pirellulaceae bacterium]MDP7017464.1 hypothetical protein [Pirellulaceae bacterium]
MSAALPVERQGLEVDAIRRHRYGFVDAANGELSGVGFRQFPKIASLWGVFWDAHVARRFCRGDACRLFFNEPRAAPGFLTVAYGRTHRDARWKTIRAALAGLERVAEIKDVQAIVAVIASRRISDRLLARCGWEPHCPHLPGRHFIRRLA